MPGSAQIGNLAVNLSLETAAFTTGAAKARAQANGLKGSLAGLGATMKGFAGGLVGGLGIGLAASALGAAAASALKMGSALSESSQKMGVSVEALQELNLAATQSGVSQESLAGAMAKLNKNMGLLQQGSKPAVDAFAKLGLAAEDLKGKTPDEALRIIADRLNALPDVQQRVAIGAQLMGRGFSELLPLINEGSRGLENYAQKQRAQGEITTEEAKRLDELADSWDRLKIRSGVAAAKVIAMLAELTTKLDDALARWYAFRDGVISGAEQMFSRAVAYVENMVSGIGNAISGRLNAILEGVKQKINAVTEAFRMMYERVVGHSYVPDMVAGIEQSFGYLQNQVFGRLVDATEQVGGAFMDLGVQALGGIGDALADAVVNCKNLGDAFADLAKSVLADLIRMSTKMLIFRAIAALIGFNFGAEATRLNAMPADVDLPSPAPLPGLASGGSGIFGGLGGVDRNILRLNGSPIAKVSKGEQFNVSPANDRSDAQIIVNQTIAPNFAGNAATQEDLARMGLLAKTAAIQAFREERRRSS